MSLRFCDLEASGLSKDDYPIEVGWVDEDGRGEGILIKPATHWTSWSEDAERVHEITREQLQREGIPVDIVARHVAEAFRGHRIVVSAPAWDGRWLDDLLKAGGVDERLDIVDSDVVEFEAAACLRALAQDYDGPSFYRARRMLEDEMQGIVGEARNREHMRAKLRHRALADATSLWRIWRDIGEKAHETAAKWPGIPSPRGPSP